MIFRKGGKLERNTLFKYGDTELEIVSKSTYLGIVFTTGGSYNTAQSTLSGQAQKAIFIWNKYLTKFTNLGPSHVLNLFHKLISPILCYSSEVWGVSKAKDVEKVHIQFCKKLLAVKQCTQNDFIYGETGRIPMILRRHYHIIKYWLKVISSSNHKLIKPSYEMQLRDINILPNKLNWALEVQDLLLDWVLMKLGIISRLEMKHYFLIV